MTDTLLGTALDGRYRLERVINHGGSGIVFVATNEAGQEVAIKIIRASAIAEPPVPTEATTGK